jgi:multidrug efflux pump subunit AcrA (membrane-fusion protein)
MLKNYVFTLITLAFIPTLTSCRQEVHANSEPTTVPVQVRTPAVVERAESVSASGSVEGSETADVAFLVGGKVARVLVEEGQHVNRGQLLAEIEPTDYRNAFNAATAQKEAALAVSQKADAGLRKQELEQARINFEHANDEYKRMKFLVERKSLPPNDFQRYESAYKDAKERYEMAQEGTRKEDRASAEAQARAAAAQASEERKRLMTRGPRPDFRQHIDAQGRSRPDRRRRNGVFHRRPQPGRVRVGFRKRRSVVKLGAKATITLPACRAPV